MQGHDNAEWKKTEMDPRYKKAVASDTIIASDPATRKPLTAVSTGSGIRVEADKSRACDKCKFGTPDVNIHTVGQCIAIKNKVGAIWTRKIKDYFGMSCDLFVEGQPDFRDMV